MTVQLFGMLRKTAGLLLLILGMSCLISVFVSRLPDQEVCIHFYYATTTQPYGSGELILDTNSGQITPETRGYSGTTYIFSPDESQSLYAKPIPHQPELFDIYLQNALPSPQSHLLQPSVRTRSGNIELTGDQIRWSHDSQRVAYLWSNRDLDFFLSIADVAHNQIKTVTPFTKDPSKAFYTQIQEWSSDNRYLTIIDQILNRTHYTFWDTKTMTAVSYPLDAASLARGRWSPNGNLFAAIVKNENLKPSALMILDLDRPNAVIQVPLPQIDIQHLMWSPDGNALVIGYLTCGEVNCRQQWHYDLFQKDGTLIASDLAGTIINTPNIVGDTQYGPDGTTKYSGYDFNATWSEDSKRFIYIEQPATRSDPTYSVRVFDLAQHQAITQGTYTAASFGNRFFHMNRNRTLSSRVIESIPYVPLSDQAILTYIENDKISVALTGANIVEPIVLVSGADKLITLANQQWQGQYWVTDWNNKDHILIEWSNGEGKDKQLRLSTANANGDHLRTFELETEDILAPNFIYNEHRSLFGFKGKKDDQYNLYMLDLDTGMQTRLLDNVDANSFWEVTDNPQSDAMLIRSNIGGLNFGQLYIRSEVTDTPIKIDVKPRSSAIWSKDGKKILLIGEGDGGVQNALILSQDTKLTATYRISATSSLNFFPTHWSKCY